MSVSPDKQRRQDDAYKLYLDTFAEVYPGLLFGALRRKVLIRRNAPLDSGAKNG